MKSIEIFTKKGGTYIYRAAEMQVGLAIAYYDQDKIDLARETINLAMPNMYTMHPKGDEIQVLGEELVEKLKALE